MNSNLIFLIEGGEALTLVRQYVEDVSRAQDEALALGRELGAVRVCVSDYNGIVTRVEFNDKPHPDFVKHRKTGDYYPKKGTEWAKRFDAQRGHANFCGLIQEHLHVPHSLNYRRETGHGSRIIGHPLEACGFLFLSKNGPYGMWIPDIEPEVTELIADGFTVDEPALSFKPEFDGCRRIESEEWDILVAQHKLARRRATQQTDKQAA